MPFSVQNFQEQIQQAIDRRASWGLPSSGITDCFRLVDGLGDGIQGVEIEVFSTHWVVGTRNVSWQSGLEQAALELGASSVWHKRLEVEEKGELLWKAGEQITEPFLVLENGATLEISLQAGYSQGLFLDQRLNRKRVKSAVIQQAQDLGRAPQVLNTFAYTGGFSVVAALAGATTTTLDLSQPYLNWAKRNFTHNGLDPENHGWIKGDAVEWLRRWAKASKHQFEGIILDPPTFGRGAKQGKKGTQVWSVERNLPELLDYAKSLLAPGGWILLSTNSRSLHPKRFERILREDAPELSWKLLEMPPEFTGEPYLRVAWGELKPGS